MKLITQEDKKKINKLYLELGTYAAVARATGFSPGTVKKYVIPGYTYVEESAVKRYDRDGLPDLDPMMFREVDWGDLCILSEEECREIKELWKELEL